MANESIQEIGPDIWTAQSLVRTCALPPKCHPPTWMCPGMQVDSILEAVFIVSPKMENLGILDPMRPVTQSPVWIPIRT